MDREIWAPLSPTPVLQSWAFSTNHFRGENYLNPDPNDTVLLPSIDIIQYKAYPFDQGKRQSMPTRPPPIDFDETLPNKTPNLPLPNELDSLEELAAKIASYAGVIQRGKSLALHTGFKATPHSERDPVKLAIEGMSPMERDEYDVWSEGGGLLDFDWEANKEELPTGKDSAKRFVQRATAMDTAWKVDKATPENAVWLTNHMPENLPLLKALVRIKAAKMALSGGIPGQDASELAEYQTINKIRSLTVQVEEKRMRVVRQLEADIHRDMMILKERADSLELKKPSKETKLEVNVKKEDPDDC